MYCILIDAHLSDGAQLAMHDVFSLRGIDKFKVSTRVCVSTHSDNIYLKVSCITQLYILNWRGMQLSVVVQCLIDVL